MMKILLILCMASLTVGCVARRSMVAFGCGCAAGKSKHASSAALTFADANAAFVPVEMGMVKHGVISIKIKRADKIVYEEAFDQPMEVVRGACPRQSFLPDWRVMPRMDDCLVWSFDDTTFAYGLQADMTVTYVFADIIGEQASN